MDKSCINELYTRLVKTLLNITPNYEIIYINDSSPDKPMELLQDLASKDPNLKVVDHSRNFGLMGVFSTGLQLATGDAVVLMDGDLQDPPEIIEEFVKKWKEDNVNVVYGEHARRKESAIKVFLFKAFYKTWNYLADISIPENAGDFSLMDRSVVDVIVTLPEKERFIRGLRAWAGFSQSSVSFIRDERFAGESTQSFYKYFSWAVFAITSFSVKPLRIVSIFSILIFLLSVFYLIALGVMYFSGVDAPHGFMTLIGVILILFSSNFLVLAIFSEYMSQLFKEIKSRPSSVVKTKINFE